MSNKFLDNKWQQFKGNLKKTWEDLTDEELTDELMAQKEKLVGLVQEKYGKAREVAEKEVSEWQAKFNFKFKGDGDKPSKDA